FDRDGDRLVPNEAEQATIERMRSRRAAGVSLGRIAAELNAAGIRPKRGARWYPSSVKWVVESGVAAGVTAAARPASAGD
ncbi:MAG TPA: recombinase family protein, partial [Azospirillum sp.]|nr:recombinase family protein [Azospirillum sp.]